VPFIGTAYSQKNLTLNLQPKEDTEVSPIVKEKVDEYARKIDSIIQEEKADGSRTADSSG
jgi:hypothetical protein